MPNQSSRALAFKQLRSLRRRLRRSIKQMSHVDVPLPLKARNILQAREYIGLATIMLSDPEMSATDAFEQELRHTTRQTLFLTRRYFRYVVHQLENSVPCLDLAKSAETADHAQGLVLSVAKKILADSGLHKASQKLFMKVFKKELKGKPFGLSCDPDHRRLALALVGKDPGLAVFKNLADLHTGIHHSDLIVANDDIASEADDDDDDNNTNSDDNDNDQEDPDGSITESDYVDAHETTTTAEDTPIKYETVSRGRHETIERFWD